MNLSISKITVFTIGKKIKEINKISHDNPRLKRQKTTPIRMHHW